MKKVSEIYTFLNQLYEPDEGGFKLFNVYHFRKTDELVIQLKDGKGGSATHRVKCLYPVYRFPISKLKDEENILKSIYFIQNKKCDKFHVNSELINTIGTLNARNEFAWKDFHPEKYLTYNVVRPEYYLTVLKNKHLEFEETRIGAIDIEVHTPNLVFPEPTKAEYPITMATLYTRNSKTANVFYLDGFDIEDDLDTIKKRLKEHFPQLDYDVEIKLYKYTDEKELIINLINFANSSVDLVLGWNSNDFDFNYITNRARKLEIELQYDVASDGFGYCYVFKNFFSIDYINLYKFFVDKNPASMKLGAIAEKILKKTKLDADTFLDIAYNITDTLLVDMIEEELRLVQLMFTFKESGSLLHVFNIKNALEPLFIKFGLKNKGSFIANSFTLYYNIYYNEMYKLINRDILGIEDDEQLHILKFRNLPDFLSTLREHRELLDFYLKQDEKKQSKASKDSAGAILDKVVDAIFKKRESKKEEKTVDISTIGLEKNIDMSTDSMDDALVKLYALNTSTIFGYPGAYNKSFRGMAERVIDLDFFSMYPTIIYALNISLETAKFLVPFKVNILNLYDKDLYESYVKSKQNIGVYDFRRDRFHVVSWDKLGKIYENEDNIISNTGVIFTKKRGFIPEICSYFLEVRKKYKEKMEKEEDIVKKNKYNIYQLLYKVYNNSVYGYMGYRYSLMFNRILVSCVTLMGRSQILYANYMINEYLNRSDGND